MKHQLDPQRLARKCVLSVTTAHAETYEGVCSSGGLPGAHCAQSLGCKKKNGESHWLCQRLCCREFERGKNIWSCLKVIGMVTRMSRNSRNSQRWFKSTATVLLCSLGEVPRYHQVLRKSDKHTPSNIIEKIRNPIYKISRKRSETLCYNCEANIMYWKVGEFLSHRVLDSDPSFASDQPGIILAHFLIFLNPFSNWQTSIYSTNIY